jgi:methionyl-tRNA formyltransferase
MNVFLCGQKEFGAAVFRRLLRDGVRVMGVCCPLTNARGQVDRLRDVANTYDVPIIESGTLQANLFPVGVDLIVCAHSHDFIGAATRRKAVYGAIGFHPSLLPRHRGRDAVRWTLKMKDAVTGGTVYWLDDRMDAGPVAAQRYCFVDPCETVYSLWREKLFPMGVEMISEVVMDVSKGKIVKECQNELHATFEPACNPPPVQRPDLLRLELHPVELMGPWQTKSRLWRKGDK